MPSLMTEIETVGRRTGLTRRVPVAITYDGDEAWVIAQHGTGTGWGANISATPKVRIRRRGEWVDGQAQIMPDDVPARVKTFASGKIRSALTASAFRGLQTDPVSVRIKLALDSSTD
ncbi:MAG: nitroreductase family deazaflavin-dependent oxidoreductase [Rhodococcus qingshengii]